MDKMIKKTALFSINPFFSRWNSCLLPHITYRGRDQQKPVGSDF